MRLVRALKVWLTLGLLVALPRLAECQIIFANPSFEGSPAAGAAPPNWFMCTGSPDILPGFWGTTQTPTDGSTYLGFHHEESVAANFPNGIGTCSGLQFTMDVSIVPLGLQGNSYWDANAQGNNPGYICIYGGFSSCDIQELLWQSELLTNVSNWQTINVQLTASQNFTYLNFAPCVNTYGNYTYFGIDNIQGVVTAPLPVDVPPAISACSGGPLNLTASLEGATSYAWTGPNGFTSNLQNPVIPSATVSASGIYTVTAMVGNCPSAPTDVQVTVSDCPDPISGIINQYTPVTAFNPCNNSVTVGNATPFAAGDRALLIQMMGATIDLTNTPAFGNITALGDAGNYEFVEIAAINGNDIQLLNALANSYTVSGAVQLITVPQYTDLTVTAPLTCAPWDGQVGGVLVFEASGTATLLGDIDVTGKGFGFGNVSPTGYNCPGSLDFFYANTSYFGAEKGKGIATVPLTHANGMGRSANGGGGGNNVNAGGGGGGNFGAGGKGGNSWEGCPIQDLGGRGGLAMTYSNAANRIFMGGGGGGGQQNNLQATPGTAGGGIVLIRSNTIVGNGAAVNAGALDATIGGCDAAGGGGAGGTVLLDVTTFSGALNINAKGGNGAATSCYAQGASGGGGGGGIWSVNPLPGNVTVNVSGGTRGIHGTGSEDGLPGSTLTGLVMEESTTPWSPLDTPSFAFNIPCPGEDLTLSGIWSGPPVTFSWTGPASFTATGQNATVPNVSAANEGIYTLTVTDALGCTASFDSLVTVLLPPVISAGPDVSTCPNEGVQVSATGGVSYLWSPATGLNDAALVSPTFTGTTSATLTVTGMDANGCTATDDVTVTVLTIPTTATALNICEGDVYVLPDGATATVSGTYQSILTGSQGCDSIVNTTITAIDCTPDVGCDLICNVDFEDTQVIAPGSFTLVNDASIPCWSTTASDAMIEVWGNGFLGVPSYSGNQYIELNANLVSTLYQDFVAVPGSTVDISFAHRGREGVDVMSVSIGPLGGPYVSLGTFSTGNTAWQYYTVNYTFPAIAQIDYSLRFNSISAAGGNPGAGNLLDAISITMPALVVSSQVVHPGCPQATDGTIDVAVSGGLPPYSIAWDAPLTATTLQVTDLAQGDYGYMVTDANGCSDTATVTLVEQFTSEASSSTVEVCTGETVLLPGGTSVTQAGVYVDTLQTVNGCDSIVTTTVGLFPVYATTVNAVICDGETHVLPGGASATTSGTYIDNFLTINGCDSIITTELLVNPSPVTTVPISICLGQSYLAEGAQQTIAGTYYDTLSTTLGCDSIIIAQLVIEPLIVHTITEAVCPGDSVFTAGYWKTVPATYNDTLQTPLGCDSLVVTGLSNHPSPVAAIAVSNSCLDEPLTVTDASTVSIGSIAAWDWDLGNDSTSTVQQPAPQSYPSAGIYTIQLIVWTNNGCTDTTLEQVEIYPLPLAEFTADSVCFGLPVQFTDQSMAVGPYPITQWGWVFGDGQTSVLQHPQVLFTAPGPQSAELTVTNSVGCKTDTALSNAMMFPVPVAVIDAPADHCLLDTAVFQDLSTLDVQWGDGIVAWLWDIESGTNATVQEPWHVFGSHGEHIVSLTVTTSNGCDHATTATIEVFARPVAAMAPFPKEGCEPLKVDHIDQSTIAPPYALGTWHWDLGNGTQTGAQFPSVTYDYAGLDGFAADTMHVTLWVESANGCASLDTAMATVVVYPLPAASFDLDPQVADMVNPTITFTDGSTPNVTDWHWTLGDGQQSSQQNPVHVYADTGLYAVMLTVTTQFNCTAIMRGEVTIAPAFNFYVPNAFTPNSNGRNEVFRGVGEGYTDHRILMFDRWGAQIFEGEGDLGWDGTYKGTPVEVGVYAYLITVKDWIGDERRFVGHVNLVR